MWDLVNFRWKYNTRVRVEFDSFLLFCLLGSSCELLGNRELQAQADSVM